MKTQSPKTYTLAQVGKLLGIGLSTVYDYINGGLIKTVPRVPGVSAGKRVPEAEYARLKRDGIDSTGIKAKLAERGPIRAAKKTALRGAVAAAAKKRVKRKAAATAAKKQVKRAAATRGAAKKQKRR